MKSFRKSAMIVLLVLATFLTAACHAENAIPSLKLKPGDKSLAESIKHELLELNSPEMTAADKIKLITKILEKAKKLRPVIDSNQSVADFISSLGKMRFSIGQQDGESIDSHYRAARIAFNPIHSAARKSESETDSATDNSINSLKYSFAAALETESEGINRAERIISEVSKNGVTQSERRHLKRLILDNQDLLTKDELKRLRSFTGKEIENLFVGDPVSERAQGLELPCPKFMRKDRELLEYSWVNAPLFMVDPKPEDIRQGMIGNCYLLSALGSLASQNPAFIKSMITDNNDGTYTVRFYEDRKPVFVKVDGRMPTRNKALYYAHTPNNAVLWPCVLEKAFAQYKGGYEAIGVGDPYGFIGIPLFGRRGKVYTYSGDRDHARMFGIIKAGIDDKKRVVTLCLYRDFNETRFKGMGFVSEHAYAVLNAEAVNGRMMITLRNPWGEIEPGDDGKDDGVFTIDCEQLFDHVAVLLVI